MKTRVYKKFNEEKRQNFDSFLKVRTKTWFIVIFLFWLYLVLLKIEYFTFLPLPFTNTGLFSNFKLNISFEKLKLFLKSFLILTILNFSCLGYGRFVITRILRGGYTKSSSVLTLVVLGYGIVALVIFLIGVLGWIYKLSFIVVICLGILSFLWYRREIFKDLALPQFNFLQWLLFSIFLYSVFINLLGALTPETFFDSQFYLLGLLNQWKLQHKITFNSYIFSSLFPFNINMLYLISLVLNNDISAKLMHWFFGIICCFMIYTFMKKYFSKTAGLVAVLIFYTVPTVMAVSWRTAIELGICMFETAMVLCMLEYFTEREKSHLLLSGIFAGLALGSKYLVLLEFFAISVAFFIFEITINKEKILDVFKKYFCFLLIALMFCSAWYLRNLVITGNPVFPFFAHKVGFIKPRIIGNIFADPPFPKFTFKNYFLFLWPLTLGQLQQESYPGGIFLIFLPFLFMFKNVDRKIKFLAIYVVICTLLWIIIGRFYLRYFIPVLSIVAILYAYFIVENSLPKSFKNLVYVLFLFIIASNINFAMRILHFTQTPVQFVFTEMTIKEYLSTQRPSYPCPYYQVADWVNRNLPKDAVLLLLGETRGLFFERKYLTHGVLEYSPLIETLKKVNSKEELYEEFRKKNITHMLLNVPEAKRLAGYDNFYFEPKELRIWCEFWNKYVREIYRDIADISLPERGIFSVKKQVPNWWQRYALDPFNYVYLYEIISKEEAEKPHQPPYNFFLHKELYSQERWEKLKLTVDEIIANYR